MKKIKILKINKRSESGFTMTDLIIALIIFSVLTGVIGSLLYASYKLNLEIKMTGAATNYAIQILEDIDKISYSEVTNGMEELYMDRFSIPTGFNLSIEVSNEDEQDLIKNVKLTISHQFLDNSEKIVINNLKVKEM